MIVGLAVGALFAAQLFVVARAHLGGWAPDPTVLLAAFAAMYLPWRKLLLAAVLMGWVRALVLLEPAGGQVLCAWGALVVVAGLRSQLALRERLGYVLASVLVAGSWSLLGRLLSGLFDAPLTGGRELLLGALLALPLAGLAPRAAAGLELEPAP